MTSEIVEQLEPLFKPRSVAVIGASNNPVKWGGMVMNRALASDFRGRIHPVNPREAKVFGVPAYADVSEIAEPVDLAVFTIPAAQLPKAMEGCVKKGIRAGVVISADFAETGARGRELEEQTVAIARAGGLRFMGPNGNGMWSSAVRLNLSPLPNPPPGGLAFVSQSGMFGGAAMRAASGGRFGLSKFLSIGNQADLTAADYVEYLAEDEDTRVIALYIEGFKAGRRFLDVARATTRRKPVLLLKGGSSGLGARATLTHTASIAGEDRIVDGMCRQAGLIRVSQLEQLFIAAQALLQQPLPRGGRVAVVGNGGQSVTTVDNLAALGLDVPEFSDRDKQALKALLPPHAPVPRNPVDFAAGAVGTEEEVEVLEKLASLDYIDGIITGVPRDRSLRARGLAEQKRAVITAVEALCRIPEKYGKPLITQSMMPSPLVSELLADAQIPTFHTTQDCALAMHALASYAAIRARA